jgi:hypothetical protein
MLATLKPNLPKIILAVALFAVAYLAQASWWNAHIADYWAYGFPFQFQESWGPCQIGEVCRAFNWLPFIADVVIWYVISAVIVSSSRAVWGKDDESLHTEG